MNIRSLTGIDMREATRLVRAGRLVDATDMLRRGLARKKVETEPDVPFHASPRALPGPAAPTPRPSVDQPGTPAPGAFGNGPATRAKARRRPDVVEPAKPTGPRFEVRSVENAAGARAYKLYVPSGYDREPVPLVVMLHGCTQSADDFAAGTRMNALAEEFGFLVAYPEQTKAANASRCWNWFKPDDQRRDGGEPSLIADATRQIMRTFAVDPKRVFVAGLSAGGAAAMVMGCEYPDLYKGVGVHSGLACGAAGDLPSAFAAMRGGAKGRARSGAAIPTIVFHGTADRTVSPVNAASVLDQAVGSSAAGETTPGRSADGMGYRRTVQRDAAGRATGEQWMLIGAGHAWSGGSPDGSFTDPRGPDASREMLRFFGIA